MNMWQSWKQFSPDYKMTRKTVIMITSGILMTEAIWQLYQAYRHYRKGIKHSSTVKEPVKELREDADDNTRIFEVMFFSSDSALCRPHMEYTEVCTKANCAVAYIKRIIQYLDSATVSLDVCMYFFTCQSLAKVIANAQRRGVVVRIATDESMGQNNSSQTMYMYKEGLRPKTKQLNGLMHHKFVIVDGKILITGSVNWTLNAFFGNFENILVTNELALVKPFVNEFENIWRMFNADTDVERCEYIPTRLLHYSFIDRQYITTRKRRKTCA